jgi:hypothetical protein
MKRLLIALSLVSAFALAAAALSTTQGCAGGTTGEGEGEGVINPNAAECEAESPVDTPTSSTPIVLVAFLGVLFALAWRRP